MPVREDKNPKERKTKNRKTKKTNHRCHVDYGLVYASPWLTSQLTSDCQPEFYLEIRVDDLDSETAAVKED